MKTTHLGKDFREQAMYEDNGFGLRWDDLHDAIRRNVDLINQLHGCRYRAGVHNPCKIRWVVNHGFEVCYCGEVLSRYALHDVNAAKDALSRLDLIVCVLGAGSNEHILALFPPKGA